MQPGLQTGPLSNDAGMQPGRLTNPLPSRLRIGRHTNREFAFNDGGQQSPGDSQVVNHGCGRTLSKDNAFQERIARQSIRTVHSGRRHFTGGGQSRQRRPAMEIRIKPAHEIVCSRHHGYRLLRDVETVLQTKAVDLRESNPNVAGRNITEIEPYLASNGYAFVYGARNNISRRELINETIARIVNQQSSLTTHGFGNQKRLHTWKAERRRMKLNKLHIAQQGARTISYGKSISCCDRRICCLPINLTGATRGNQDGCGGGNDAPFLLKESNSRNSPVHNNQLLYKRKRQRRHSRQRLYPG